MIRGTHWRRVPPGLALEARERSTSGYVDSAAQCQLSAHNTGEHHGLLDDLEYGTALWLRWSETAVALAALPDCPAVGPGPDGEGCCLFLGHTTPHTWADMDEEVSASEDRPSLIQPGPAH
ncbi:hypothetical protein ACFTXO_25495 [Streptomyces sp. NPDC057067]|uniref:hypothetical protein n=1 Tax=Streptomyces TaxID=1883 RepID=UPI0027DD5799|nr:hypothetical protein [Streptomyces silvae]